MGIINQNNGLFSQQFKLGLTNSTLKMEKVTLGPITKGKVEITIDKGSKAIINGEIKDGQHESYKYNINELGIDKNGKLDVILIPNQMMDTIEFGLFAGRHEFALEELKSVKLEYAVVIHVNLEVIDHKTLVQYFNNTYTEETFTEAINEKIIESLAGSCATIMTKYACNGFTPTQILEEKSNIYMELKTSTIRALNQFGVALTGISKIKFNPTDKTTQLKDQIKNKINDNAIDSLNDDERKRQQEELEKQRQHEINLEKAKNSKIIEKTENINKSNNGNEKNTNKRFCPKCGKEVDREDSVFCTYCGTKL